jgi:hypothetical protein
MSGLQLESLALSVDGRVLRTARLSNEGYEFITDPTRFVQALQAQRQRVDVLSFCQPLVDTTPQHRWRLEWDELAVLPISSYDHWWKVQVNDKTRNMVRKPGKKGVVLRHFELDDAAVRGIKLIYDENPMRQGRPFKHFNKPLEQLAREHATFAERSEFIGAYLDERLIGFIKLVHQDGWSNLMQIISLIAERDKAPTNGLIAKAVEICAARGVPRLQYGIWSRRGIGDFKLHHGFEPLRVPRYQVPISTLGQLALAAGLHKPMRAHVPEPWIDTLAQWRSHWHGWRLGTRSAGGARESAR